MSKKLNLAILGCGRISRSHIKAIIKERERCNLIAICDKSSKKMEETFNYVKEEFSKKNIYLDLIQFKNLKDLLFAHNKKLINIDLLIICTPSGLHCEQAIEAAKSYINICTEKPMALNVSDCKRMIQICKEQNVKLFIVKQNRLNTTLKDLKTKLEKKMFGKIGIISLNVFWHRPQAYYDQDSWRGTPELDGGALMNQASHYVDLLEWLFGPVKSVSANIATIARNIEVEDTAVLNLKWEKGTLGTMAVTMITYPKNIEGSITIIGDKGSAKIGGEALNKYEFFYFNDEFNENELKQKNYEIKNVYGSGHYEFYKNMINAINNDEPPICDGESGLSSVKIINAAYLSSKTGKVIEFK